MHLLFFVSDTDKDGMDGVRVFLDKKHHRLLRAMYKARDIYQT